MRWLSIHTPRINSLSLHTRLVRQESTSHTSVLRPQFTFAPAVGKHLIRYHSSWFLVERKRERGMSTPTDATLSGLAPWETLTLSTFSTFSLSSLTLCHPITSHTHSLFP